MDRAIWLLTRSSGVVATILIVAALLWGFLFSARDTGRRLRPAWWLDLHNYLGGLALVFVGVHIVASMLDSVSGIGLLQALVPGTAAGARWAIGWGVVATWGLAAVVFTTWPRRLANRRWWRIIHLTSVVATALGVLHAYQAGTDATRLWLRLVLLAAVAVSTYGVALRLLTLDRSSGRRRGGTSGPAGRSQQAHS